MSYQVFLTPTAKLQLADTISYLQSEWGMPVVKAFQYKIDEALDLLAAFPKIGQAEMQNPQI